MLRRATSFVLRHATRFPRYSSGRHARVALGLSTGTFCFLYTLRTVHLDANNSTSPLTGRVSLGIKVAQDIALSSDEISEILRLNEKSSSGSSDTGITRYDEVWVASNNPSEDAHYAGLTTNTPELPTISWSLFGVFDGHNGWQTKNLLCDSLVHAVIGALSDLYSKFNEFSYDSMPQSDPPPDSIDDTIKFTFKEFDDLLVHDAAEQALSLGSKATSVKLLAPALAGSCALLAFYDHYSRLLRVALTGDSRAVLGRRIRDESGKDMYTVHVLSRDQNAYNADEEARLSALHPGEKIVENGRVLGWGMSRAFGDGKYKWSRDIQTQLRNDHLGGSVPSNVKTPPYLTAEPVITTTKVKPGDFMVLATDGLWDCLTNEEVVGLIGMWLDQQEKGKTRGVSRDELPINMGEDRTVMYRYWGVEKRFVNVDDNAATHLTRNALGGADQDLLGGLLALEAPMSRKYRDDLTAVVVFFDDEASN